MATTTEQGSGNSRPVSTAKSYTSIQVVKAEIDKLISAHFSGTLGTIPEVTKYVLACVYKESTFNSKANSGIHGDSQLRRFLAYSAISSKMNNPATSEQEKANMRNSVAGFGLMQATGWYLIKGAGPGGKNELMRMRPDLAPQLIVEPGIDINTKLGPGMITNQLLVGLIILEDKFKVAPSLWANPTTQKKPYTDRISATFGGFLGKGTDKFGSTPQSYASSIIHGDAYAKANGTSSKVGFTNSDNNDKSTAVASSASGNSLGPPGC